MTIHYRAKQLKKKMFVAMRRSESRLTAAG